MPISTQITCRRAICRKSRESVYSKFQRVPKSLGRSASPEGIEGHNSMSTCRRSVNFFLFVERRAAHKVSRAVRTHDG